MGSRRTKLIAAVAALAILAILAGATVVPDMLDSRRSAACDAIVEDFVATLQTYIDEVDGLTAEQLQGAQSVGALFSATVPSYQRDLAESRCDEVEVRATLASEVAGLRWDGAVAGIVGSIVQATVRGDEVEPAAEEVRVRPSDDLAAAVAVAPAGTMLQLESGEYRIAEPLVFQSDATIVGAGRSSTTIVSEAPDFALLHTGGGTLTLSDFAIVRDADAPGAVVVVSSGGYDFEGIAVRGGVVDADGGSGAGLVLGTDETDDAQGVRRLTDVEVSDNEGAGIAVAATHAPDIVDVVVVDNGRCGVCFLGESAGTLRDSRVERNETGIAVSAAARPRIARVVVEDNTQAGIVFEGEAAGEVRDSVVRGNGSIGLLVVADAAPLLSGNDVSGHSEAGVAYRDAATGLLDGNELSDQPVGVWLEGTAAPQIARNVVTETDIGFVFTSTSAGELDDNRTEGLRLGVEVRDQATPSITGNSIEGSDEAALLFRDDAIGSASGNTCIDSTWLALIDAADPVLGENDCELIDQR